MNRFALWIVVLALAAPACASEAASPREGAAPETSTAARPSSVAETRAAILAAAEAGDYERLRPVLDPAVFLSDFGFGADQPDPIARWQELGPKPLETMGVVLRMSHTVKQTNEGTLYEWPTYGPDSRAGDLSADDRELFRTIMSEERLDGLILPELGYTGPRLGILTDGTWWFFILESEG